jgi:hypothetical protein
MHNRMQHPKAKSTDRRQENGVTSGTIQNGGQTEDGVLMYRGTRK